MADIKWSAFTSGGEMQVGDQTVGLRAGDNRRFTFPGTGIKDASGNYLLGWSSPGAGAVNYIQITSSATGVAPQIAPIGTDANINLLLSSKGNGNIVLTPSGTGNITASTTLILSTNNPSTALEAASKGYVDSVAPTFPVSLAQGGTGAALIASNGGIFYSNATTGAILAGTATANRALLSGASSAPSWSTATYPPTTTINQLLYSSAANTITGLSTANNGVLITSATGVPSFLANTGNTGNVLRSNAAAPPAWSTALFADTYAVSTILYASSTNNVSGLATANNGVLITSGTGVPSISSTLPSAVQGNITSLGTITTGVWNGTLISPQFGGTGVNNGTSTMTIGGNFSMVGGFTFAGTLTGNTAVTFPTSGTLATTSQIPALPVSLANGGTGASLTAANGGIFYSNATTGAILAPTATGNQLLLSGSNTAPAWSTTTYPSTNAINTIMYASAANTLGSIAAANSSVMLSGSTGVPAWSGAMTNGQLIIGSTGASPVVATLTAGAGITITNSAGGISIAAIASGAFTAMNVQTFSTSGTYTPTTGMKYILCRAAAGGGGGGGADANPGSTSSAGNGGGSGSFSEGLFTAAQVGASKTVTIGAGGTAGSGGTGGTGGVTSFGALMTTSGGTGGGQGPARGAWAPTPTVGVGGAAGSGGYNNFRGGSGGVGFASATTNCSGMGAWSFYGGGGQSFVAATGTGSSTAANGAGGGGATGLPGSAAQAGGAGGGGYMEIIEFI